MIDVRGFDAEITDPADVFIGTARGTARIKGGADDEPYLYVVLPCFAFKVRLTHGNLSVLRLGLDEWAPVDDFE